MFEWFPKMKELARFEGLFSSHVRNERAHLTRLAVRARRAAGLLAVYLLSIPQSHADDGSVLGRDWGIYGLLNVSNWSGLGDVQPLGSGGPFDTSGRGLDLGGYVSVAQLGSAVILVGGELGFLGFNSDVIFSSDRGAASAESAFEVNRISGSVKFRFGRPNKRYLDVGLGLGEYIADSKYVDCSVITNCFGADTGGSAVGAYLELSGSPGKGVIVGIRMHNVEFDPIEAVDLGVKPLKGPIYSVFAGWEFGSWRR